MQKERHISRPQEKTHPNAITMTQSNDLNEMRAILNQTVQLQQINAQQIGELQQKISALADNVAINQEPIGRNAETITQNAEAITRLTSAVEELRQHR